jgi:hypothetical protein
MGLIHRRNISSFSFEIDLKYGMNVGRCEQQKRTIQLLKVSYNSQEYSVLIS